MKIPYARFPGSNLYDIDHAAMVTWQRSRLFFFFLLFHLFTYYYTCYGRFACFGRFGFQYMPAHRARVTRFQATEYLLYLRITMRGETASSELKRLVPSPAQLRLTHSHISHILEQKRDYWQSIFISNSLFLTPRQYFKVKRCYVSSDSSINDTTNHY